MKRAGDALSVVVLLLSAALAGRLGFSLGASEVEKFILATVSVALEGWKVLLPFVIAKAWQRRHVLALLVLPPLWLLLTAYSFIGGLSFAEGTRASVAGDRAAAVARAITLKADLAETHRRLATIGTTRSIAELETLITSKRQTPIRSGRDSKTLTAASNDCTIIVSKRSVELCAEVAGLSQQLAQARERHRLETRRAELDTTLATLSGLDHAGVADPQLTVLVALTGLTPEQARRTMGVIFAALLELIGGLGLFLSSLLTATGTDATRHAAPDRDTTDAPVAATETDLDRLERYLATASSDDSASIVASTLYADYGRWVERQGATALSLTAFGVALAKRGTAKTKIDGRIHYQGFALPEHDTP